MRTTLLSLATLFLTARCTVAKEFTILLAKEKTGAHYNDNGPYDAQFDPTKKLREWGSTGQDAGNFHNNSSKTILGMKFISKYPDKHHFAADCSGGDLFTEVWMNGTHTEIIFRHAAQGVAPDSYFWMQATRTADEEEGYYLFQALMFDHEPSIPKEGNWRKINPAPERSANKATSKTADVVPEVEGVLVTEQDDGKTVSLALDKDRLVVLLKYNPGAGEAWRLAQPCDRLLLLGKYALRPQPLMAGSNYHAAYIFRTRKKGTCDRLGFEKVDAGGHVIASVGYKIEVK